MGYTLKNIEVIDWKYLSASGVETLIETNTTLAFGIFCKITGATITDLIVDSFSYAGPTQSSAIFGSRGTADRKSVV